MINDAKTLLLRMEATLRKQGALDAGATTAQRGLVAEVIIRKARCSMARCSRCGRVWREPEDEQGEHPCDCAAVDDWDDDDEEGE